MTFVNVFPIRLNLILRMHSFACAAGYVLTHLRVHVQSRAHASAGAIGDKSATGMFVITGSSDTRLAPSPDGLGTLHPSVENSTGDR